MMSNKELAAQCLIEAANILNEASSYDYKGYTATGCKEGLKVYDSNGKYVGIADNEADFRHTVEQELKESKTQNESVYDIFDDIDYSDILD